MWAPSLDKTTAAGSGPGRTERMLVPENRDGRKHWGEQRDSSQFLRQDHAHAGPMRMGFAGMKPETHSYVTSADQDQTGHHTYGMETTRDTNYHMNGTRGGDNRIAYINNPYDTRQDNSARDTVGLARRGLYTNRWIDPRADRANPADRDSDMQGVGEQGEHRSALRTAGETQPKPQSLTNILFEEMGYLRMEVPRGAGAEAMRMRTDVPSDASTAATGAQGRMRPGASKTEEWSALVAQRKGDWAAGAPPTQGTGQQPPQKTFTRASSIAAHSGGNSAVAHT